MKVSDGCSPVLKSRRFAIISTKSNQLLMLLHHFTFDEDEWFKELQCNSVVTRFLSS